MGQRQSYWANSSALRPVKAGEYNTALNNRSSKQYGLLLAELAGACSTLGGLKFIAEWAKSSLRRAGPGNQLDRLTGKLK